MSTATGITLVAATSLIGYVLYRRRRSLSSARTRVDGDLSTILADRDQSEMEKPKVSTSEMHDPGGRKRRDLECFCDIDWDVALYYIFSGFPSNPRRDDGEVCVSYTRKL